MKHRVIIALACLIGFLLGGCAQLQTAWHVVEGVSVSPDQILIAANAFDAGEATATQYLLYCKANKTVPACARSTRVAVVAAVRSGRVARAQLEPYVVSGTAGPSAIYNTLVAVISQLQTQIPTSVAIGATK